VPYRDDRQVKFLYVDLDQCWPREQQATGSTWIIIRPARDAATDLRMAHEISGQHDPSEKARLGL
jgi:hypothetical protein